MPSIMRAKEPAQAPPASTHIPQVLIIKMRKMFFFFLKQNKLNGNLLALNSQKSKMENHKRNACALLPETLKTMP